MPGPDLAAEDMIGVLESLYCHNVVSLWADAVANRPEGPAICLLSAETHRRADAAAALAGQGLAT
jgi:hypothetical protein